MAISRMQQPRQMYGLGSFVKKAVRKVTKPFTKVAKKIVPKEVAGIMRVAAPFLPPGYREAAYLLGTAKQTGRISPMDLALTLAPTIGKMQTSTGQTVGQRLGALDVPFTDRNLKEVLVGGKEFGNFGDVTPTKGIFGQGGEMFQLGKGALPGTGAKQNFGVLDTKAGQFLLGGEDGKFSKAKVAGVGVGVLSLIQNSKTPDEAGKALAASTGNSDDYERGYQLFSQLTPELFEVPEQFRMNVKDGGIMRTNYARGSDDELPEDPTKPINPFQPKPTGPVLPDKKMAEFDLLEYQEEFERVFPDMKEKRGTDEYNEMLEDYFRGLAFKDDNKGIMMASSSSYQNYVKAALSLGLKPIRIDEFESLTPIMNINEILKITDDLNKKISKKEGGRVNLALGTKPTAEESGLGGLPIEADMRYTGGFMPYGAKEKADDVPARLSKNEFVFTADAVRAAGGGSVNEGAKKMYATMKQLEAKPEAKGMTA